MGYSIRIGRAELRYDVEECTIGPYVDDVVQDDAPVIEGEPGYLRQKNARMPSYTEWGAFTRRTGLMELFFDAERGLMREHPGIAPITLEHLKTVRDAEQRLQEAHPDAEARWRKDDPPHNYDLARLQWLAWWMEWALKHYSWPALENS